MAAEPKPPDCSQTLFPTTRWTIVRSIGGAEPALRFQAWDDFCRCYRRPLLVWLAVRTTPENAEDLVQDFLLKLHQRESLFGSLVPDGGRLRSYLLAALRNHWFDHLRSHQTRRRAGAATLTLDETGADAAGELDDRIFDHEWAVAVLCRAVEILRAEYAARGNQATFDALLTLLESDDAATRQRAGELSGLSDNTFNVALKRLRERLAARVRQEVAATLIGESDEGIDGELHHLIAVLGSNGFGRALDPPT